MRISRWFAVAMLAVFSGFVINGCSSVKVQTPAPEKKTEYGYPADYHVKPLYIQVHDLGQYFPELRPILPFDEPPPLPVGAEGYFVIPRWQLLAPTYGEAVEKVFAALAIQRPFYSWYYEDKLGPEYLRRTEHATAMWEKLELENGQRGSDILVVPAQFGLYHRGKSVKEARASFAENEFGLGAYEVAIMLLTHPERLQSFAYPWIDAPGDEYSQNADGDFSYASVFSFSGVYVRFDASWFDYAHEDYGSASAFVSPASP